MPTYQEIHTRGQQTVAVWEHHAPTYSPGGLTLAPHQADVAAMPGADQAVVNAEAVIDEKRDLRDAKLALIVEVATRVPRAAATELSPEDSLQDDIRQLQGINMDSLQATVDRGQHVRAVWSEVNARLAAAAPPKPALTVLKAGGGQWTLADLVAAVEAIEPLEQAVKNAATPLGKKRAERRTLATRVDRTNKRWYEAWAAHFPAGSPEHDALSQITTEGGGSGGGGEPGNGGGTPEPPAAPTGVSFAQENAGDPVTADATLPEGTTLVKFLAKLVGASGEPDLVASTALPLPHSFAVAPGDYEFTMTATTAAGESAPSAPVTLTVA